MVRVVIAAAFGLTSISPVAAFDKFEEYRFLGSEVRSVRFAPQEVEDPATLIVELVSEAGNSVEITLESDGALDDCKTEIDHAIGDNRRFVEIVTHVSADTMNGVMVVRCSSVFLATE